MIARGISRRMWPRPTFSRSGSQGLEGPGRNPGAGAAEHPLSRVGEGDRRVSPLPGSSFVRSSRRSRRLLLKVWLIKRDRPSFPPISGLPEMGILLRKSGTPDLRWGGDGGGGVSENLSEDGANTPTRRFALTSPQGGGE